MGIQIHGHGHQIHITRAFAIPHKRAFYPICTGHDGQLSCGHATTTIIVGVNTDADVFPAADVVADPFNLIRKYVRGGHLHRSRQVDDNWLSFIRAPYFSYRIDNLNRKVQFRAGKALRGILERPFRAWITGRKILDHLGAVNRNVSNSGPI